MRGFLNTETVVVAYERGGGEGKEKRKRRGGTKVIVD